MFRLEPLAARLKPNREKGQPAVNGGPRPLRGKPRERGSIIYVLIKARLQNLRVRL